MCEWGNIEKIRIPWDDGWRTIDVDSCIATLVMALNICGMKTIASCCGHKLHFGSIIFADGQELIICPDSEIRKKLAKEAGINIHGEKWIDGRWQ